jgi:hypothetical protein
MMEDKFMSSKKVEKLGPVVAFYRCRKRGLEDLLGIYLSTTFFLFNFLITIKRHVAILEPYKDVFSWHLLL